MAELKEKHKRFADYYITSLDIAESYVKAGYKAANKKVAYTKGWNLLKKNEQVKNYVENRLKEIEDHRIMGIQEIKEIYTAVARSDETAVKDKLKALDALAKMNGLFVEKVQHETKIEIKLPDFEQLKLIRQEHEEQKLIDVSYKVEEETD